MTLGTSGVRKLVLPSGFALVHEVQPSCPTVAYHLWVGAGSAHENPGEGGVSHFLEHMLFKGTDSMDSVALNDAIENFGGNVNAFTSYEETAYHMVLSRRHWKEGLKILLDMVFHSRMDPEEMEVEREVILEEIREGDDVPDSILADRFFAGLYPGHPYGRPVIGTDGTVRSLSDGAIAGHYRRWYRPSNMVLAVAGDVEWERLAELVRGLVPDLNGGRPERPLVEEVVPPATRPFAVIRKGAEERIVELAFPIPGVRHEDLPAIDLLSCALGEGEMSRLYRSIRLEQNLVRAIASNVFTPFRQGHLFIRAFPHEGSGLAMVPKVLAEVHRIREHGVSTLELERAKLQLDKELLFNDEIPEGRARTLAYFQSVFGDVEEERRYRSRFYSVTEDRLNEVARAYFDPARMGAAFLVPAAEEGPSAAALDAAVAGAEPARPARGKARAARSVEHFRVKNGLRVALIPGSSSRLASLSCAVLGGLREETPGTNGVTHLIAATMDLATGTRSLNRIQEETNLLQAELGAAAGRNTLMLRMDLAARNLVRGIDLFSDILLDPAFEPEDVEQERTAILRELSTQQDYFEAAAANLFAEAIFPGHAYGLNPLGTPESLGRLAPEDLRKTHAALVRPERMALGIVGDVDQSELRGELEHWLGGFRGEGEAPGAGVPPPPLAGLAEVRRPIQGEKAYLWYGFRGPSVTSPDRHAAEVLATVLASSGGGRLYVRLREELGLLYSVDVPLFLGLDSGFLAVSLNTRADQADAAYEEVRRELETLKTKGVTPDELSRVKNFLLGSHETDQQRSSSQAALICLGELYGTEKTPEAYVAAVSAVTVDAVVEAAEKYLTLDQGVFCLMSPALN
jgi:zinc protease